MKRCSRCGREVSLSTANSHICKTGKSFEDALRAAFFAGRDSITAPKSAIDYDSGFAEKQFKKFQTEWSGLPDPVEESREKVRQVLGSEEETAELNRYEKSMGL